MGWFGLLALAAAGAAEVELPVVAVFVDGEVWPDGTAEGWVDRGWRDNVLGNSVGVRVYRRLDDGTVVTVGTADVLETRPHKTRVRLHTVEGVLPTLGDAVRLPARWDSDDAPLAWHLARERVEIHAGKRSLTRWSALRRDPLALPDDELCEAIAADARATAGWTTEPLQGRFAGLTLAEAVATADAEQACNAARYVLELSEMTSTSWRAGELYAAWVSSGAPLSVEELRETGPGLSDAAFAGLVQAHVGERDWPDEMYGGLYFAAHGGDPERALRWKGLLERWAAHDPHPEAAFYAAMAPGELAFASGDADGAIAAWTPVVEQAPEPRRPWALAKIGRALRLAGRNEEAAAAFEQGLALGDIGLRGWEDYADALLDLGRYPDAGAAYEQCVDGWSGIVLPEQPVRMAWCSMGLGRALQEQGRFSDAWDAWKVALDLADARDWDLYQARAQEGLASLAWDWRLYDRSATYYDFAADLWLAADRRDKAGVALRDASLSWWEAGRQDLAVDRVHRAMDLLREGGDPVEIAYTLHQIASFEQELGDPAAAIALSKEALAHLPADDAASRSRTLQFMALARADQGRSAEAEALIDEAIAVAREGGHARQLAFALGRRATFRGGVEDYAAAVEAWRQADDPLLLADALDSLARREMTYASHEAALAHLDEADALIEGLDAHQLRIRIRVSRAWIAYFAGDLDEAWRLAQEADEIGEKWGDPRDRLATAGLVVNLAVQRADTAAAIARADAALADLRSRPNLAALEHQGHLLRATALEAAGRYQEAGEAATAARRGAQLHGDEVAEWLALDQLGALAALDGHRDVSRRLRERALAMPVARSTPGTAETARASLALESGRFDEALASAEAALALLPATEPGLRASAQMSLGAAHALRGDLDAALPALEAAGRVPGIPPTHRASVALRIARLQLLRGEGSLALAALDRLPSPGLPALQLEADAWRAVALAELGRHDEAEARARNAEQLAASFGVVELSFVARYASGRVARARGDAAAAVTALSAAADLLDRAHASIPDPEGAAALRRSFAGDVYEELALAHEALGQPAEAAKARERRGITPLRALTSGPTPADFDDYTASLAAAVPDLLDRIAVPTSSFAALQTDLRPNEALVVPAVLPGRVVVFVVRDTGDPRWIEVAIEEQRVADLVGEMREALQSPAIAWKQTRAVRVVQAKAAKDPTDSARALHRLLIEPALPLLEGADTLIVAPGGRLRYVPFAALTDGERFLVEDYRLALLTASGSSTTHRPIEPRDGVLALSNPDGSLPGASAEVAAIQRTWGRRAIVHDGPAATEEALRAGVAGAGILHLATHGLLSNEQPRDSYLLMAGEEARLTLPEISLLPLDGVDLVVLSACETAVGEHGEGREIAGLAYQFEVRGAASVVASLWAVDDASTSELMVTLYGGLRKKRSRAEALRDAQLALLADPATAHPYYWAPFILIGDWR